MTRGSQVPLDVSRFMRREEGLRLVEEARSRLMEAAEAVRPAPSGVLLIRQVGLGVLVAAAAALHEGAVREVEAANPHSAYSLIRGLVEVFAVATYALQAPDYLQFLMLDPAAVPAGAARPKKMQALIDTAVRDGHTGIGHLYDSLSDVAHFGRGAMGLPIQVDEDRTGGPYLTLKIAPHWRDETHALAALASIEQQTLGIAAKIARYDALHIAPLIADISAAQAAGQVVGLVRSSHEGPTAE